MSSASLQLSVSLGEKTPDVLGPDPLLIELLQMYQTYFKRCHWLVSTSLECQTVTLNCYLNETGINKFTCTAEHNLSGYTDKGGIEGVSSDLEEQELDGV